MQQKYVKKNAYNSGRGATSQELIYQHMSNHYRRILNAKKVVDTSPPYCYKQKRPGSAHLVPALPTVRSFKVKPQCLGRNISPAVTARSISTNSCSCTGPYPSSRFHASCVEEIPHSNRNKKYQFDKRLIDRITYDTKNGPSAYCDHDWLDHKTETTNGSCKVQDVKNNKLNQSQGSRNSKRRLQNKENESNQKRSYSLDLENKSSPELPLELTPEVPQCKCRKLCICDPNDEALEIKKSSVQPKEQSQTSSRDSAYNGGVSSLSESRSPTPDHRIKKDGGCILKNENLTFRQNSILEENPKEKATENLKPSQDVESNCGHRISNDGSPKEICPPAKPKGDQKDSIMRKIKEDEPYIKFIEDITVEILTKNLYTNKALLKVMKKHILNNLEILEQGRMLKEVDNLRIQLGIPEDKGLFDLNQAHESVSDLLNPYPIISDSEFTMPDNKKESETDDESEMQMEDTCDKSTCFWRRNSNDNNNNNNNNNNNDNDNMNDTKNNNNNNNSNNNNNNKNDKVSSEDKTVKKLHSSDSENEELISVIQVMKSGEESMAEKTNCRIIRSKSQTRLRVSSDDSPASSEIGTTEIIRKKRAKPVFERKTSESSSEIEERISVGSDASVESGNEDDKPEDNESASEETTTDKKPRTVSFWSNKDFPGRQIGNRIPRCGK
ncbi:hypothetical protein RUM44_001322 [Polyplax serrata]|uniref:Uncharacterized protein n=1 Tax=Polyplax serrata TaxID=468196 RepID=A0ABR1AJS2_POLSC